MKLYEAVQELPGAAIIRKFSCEDADAALDQVSAMTRAGKFKKKHAIDVYDVTNKKLPARHVGSTMITGQ